MLRPSSHVVGLWLILVLKSHIDRVRSHSTMAHHALKLRLVISRLNLLAATARAGEAAWQTSSLAHSITIIVA